MEAGIIQMCYRERRPLPDKIADAPRLFQGLELYFGAFMDLNTCRSIGFGEGPISWLVINEYAIANGYSAEQHEDLFYHISEMDKTYLEYRAKEAEAKANAK